VRKRKPRENLSPVYGAGNAGAAWCFWLASQESGTGSTKTSLVINSLERRTSLRARSNKDTALYRSNGIQSQQNYERPKTNPGEFSFFFLFFFSNERNSLGGKFLGWIRRSLFRAPWNPLYYPRRFLGCYWTLLKKNVQETYGESQASSLWKALKRAVSNTKSRYKTGVFLSHFKYRNYRSWKREMPLWNMPNDSVLRDEDSWMISSN